MANLQYTDDNWLGETPPAWPVVPAKTLFSNPVERNHGDDIHLTPSQKYGVLPQVEYMEITGNRVVLNLSSADTMRHVEPGDFVSHLRSFQGGLEYSPYRGKVSAAYTVLRPKLQIEPRFYKYLFKSSRYVQGLATTTEQLRDGQSIRYEQFALLRLPYPPLEAQKAIADFLDRELEIIDALVKAQGNLLDTLAIRRKSLINEIILGKRPAGMQGDSNKWPTKRLGMAARIIEAKGSSSYAISLENISAHLGELSNEPDLVEQVEGTPFRKGDVLFGKLRPYLGKVVVADSDGVAVGDIHVYRSSELIPEFLKYWLLAPSTLDQINSATYGTKMPRANWDQIKGLTVHCPDLETQKKIVRLLDESMEKDKNLIESVSRSSQLLSDRRAALISAAVTGKIDVRGKN